MMGNHPLSGKKIIISGAGISGLAFSIALRKKWPHYTSQSDILPTLVIYEREEEGQIGRQGYSISISSDGIRALQRLGVLDDMLKVSITGTQSQPGGFHLWTRRFEMVIGMKTQEVSDLPVSSLRIARKNLRHQLVELAARGCSINWGVQCKRADQSENGKIRIMLSTGETDSCDILIAADGSRSQIRSLLRPDDKLNFAGVVCIWGTAEFSGGKIPRPVDRDWGIAFGSNSTCLFVSPIDKTKALWSLSYRALEPRHIADDEQNGELIRLEALERGGRIFAEPFKTLVAASNPSSIKIYNAMDKRPFVWPPSNMGGQVVFIGDSNHAVTAFAGNGANLALMDAWDLADQFCRSNSIHDAITRFHDLSIPRAKRTLRFSHFAIYMAHSCGLIQWLFLTVFRLLGRILRLFDEKRISV